MENTNDNSVIIEPEETPKGKKINKKSAIIAAVSAVAIAALCLIIIFATGSRFIKNGDGYKLISSRNKQGVTETTVDCVKGNKSKPVNAISSGAFGSNTTLEIIKIGANVKEIGEDAFRNCTKLKQIKVNKNNEYFCDIDGVLFDKKASRIICYPAAYADYLTEKFHYDEKENEEEKGKYYSDDVLSYTIPETVKVIGRRCFEGSGIVSLMIPYSVETIEERAFYNCTGLETIISYSGSERTYSLSSGVKTIGKEAFANDGRIIYFYIPASVESIGSRAFAGTGTRTDIEIESEKAFSVELSEKEFKEKVTAGKNWYPDKYENVNFGVKRTVNK